MLKGLKHITFEERLKKLRLFSLDGEGGNLIYMYKYKKESCKEHREKLFSLVPSETVSTTWNRGGSF